MINRARIRKTDFLLLATCVFMMISGLIGCAANKSNLPPEEQYNVTLDSDATQKALSDTTSAEYERLGDHFFGRDDLVKAFLNYEKALQLDPDNIGLHYKKGLSLLAGKINEDAIKEFQAVIKRDSGYAPAYEGLALAYYQMKEHKKSERNLKKAIELNPKLWKSHNYLGTIYDRQKKYEQAIQHYYAAIVLRPDEKILYNNLGVSYYLAGEYSRAVVAFNNALENNYVEARTYNNLGLALARLGRYREALVAFRKGGNEAQAHNNLGCIYLEQGKFKEAIDSFTKAIEINPLFYSKASDNLQKARRAYRERIPSLKTNGIGD